MREESNALEGRIELKGLLGVGGMGEVHRAWDDALERAVAVKFFKGTGPRESERLLLEGRLQARVDHPHVVRVLDTGELQGRACLVLQLVEGRSLAELAPTLSLDRRIELVRQAALGVHAAHLQGLVHRDVKPGNVLVEQGPGEPRALVSDFGLARGEEPGLTRSGMAPGTLAFMSPEQLLGDGPVGFAADVYGLGATLYAALAGHPPRSPASTSSADASSDLFRRILEAPPPALPKDVPRPLARVIAKAMEKIPAARYESAEAFAADLARFQRGEPVSARPASMAERALAWRRRNRPFARAMTGATVTLLLSVGWGIWSARRADLEALEAARLGALGESMEAQLRMEYLSPPHDLRPALARVRAQVEALRPQAARGGGAASFALGKGLELLGDVEGARAAFERAWAQGLRIPRVAEGLGNALAAQYRRAHRRACETLEPSAREQRLTALRVELRDPAIRYLALADSGGWRTAFLKASIALLEGDFPAARSRAAEVIAAESNRYEARVLQAQTHLEQSSQLEADGKLALSLAEATEAAELFTEAATWGRSDFSLAEGLARARLARLNALAAQGKLPPEELAAAREAFARAAALLPDEPAVLELQADLLAPEKLHGFNTSAPADVLRLVRESAQLYRRALQRTPENVKARCSLGRALYEEAFNLRRQGADPQAAIEEGLAALEPAIAAAPWDPAVHRVRSFLLAVQARELAMTGKAAGPALERWIEAGEEALRLGVREAPAMRRVVGEAHIDLGVELWRSGRDPRPEFEKGLALLEEARRALPGQAPIAGQVALAYATTAETLSAMGEDAGSHFSRGLEILRELMAAEPELAEVRVRLGENLYMEARQRSVAGLDPTAQATEAASLLAQAGMHGNVVVELLSSSLPIISARWDLRQGRSPLAHLQRAERDLEELLHRRSSNTDAWHLLAEACELRARWMRRSDRDPAPAAREGLEALGRAVDDSRDPGYWALRARLFSLSGDRAQARESLDRAWGINPLFKRGVESRETEAELEAAAPEAVKAEEPRQTEPQGAVQHPVRDDSAQRENR